MAAHASKHQHAPHFTCCNRLRPYHPPSRPSHAATTCIKVSYNAVSETAISTILLAKSLYIIAIEVVWQAACGQVGCAATHNCTNREFTEVKMELGWPADYWRLNSIATHTLKNCSRKLKDRDINALERLVVRTEIAQWAQPRSQHAATQRRPRNPPVHSAAA